MDPSLMRSRLQQQAVESLMRDRFVQVNWGTGVGKSRVGVESVRRLAAQGCTRFLLLVAETAHKENWRKEFTDVHGEEEGMRLFRMLTVECYASLKKYADTQWDLIVADEAHHLRSGMRTETFSTLGAERVLCLSATMSCRGDANELLAVLEQHFGHFTSLNFGIQDAINNGILGEPKIYVHVLPLEEISLPQKVTVTWGRKEKRREITCPITQRWTYMKLPAAALTLTGTAKECHDFISSMVEEAKERWLSARRREGLSGNEDDNMKTLFLRNRYNLMCSQRKLLIGRCKTLFAKSLIKKLGDRKFICFCSDVEQGAELGGGNVISASADEKFGHGHNADVIRAFNEDEIRSLFAVNMIQEGQNLKGIEAGIIIQLGGKDRRFIQEFGRTLRARCPEQHIIVIREPRDLEYYHTAVSGLDDKYIRVIPYGSLKQYGKDCLKPMEKYAGGALRCLGY